MKKLYFILLLICSFSSFAFAQTATLSGTFSTVSDSLISDVTVVLLNHDTGEILDSITTNDEGFYQFSGLSTGQTYRLELIRDDNHLNGVSTFDMVMIQQHILANRMFSSVAEYLAADVNDSQSITTLDMVIMRQVILFINTEFPNIPSWRFIRSTAEFTPSGTNNPFDNTINNNFFTTLNAAITNFDFIGVKTGDVNGSAQP